MPFLDELAERFTVYAPEHPGTTPGDPDGIRALDDLWDLVLCYDELFDALGARRPGGGRPLLRRDGGVRGGGHVPRRVSKLVLINALGLWRDDAPIPNFMVMDPAELVPLTGRRPERAGRGRGSSPRRTRVGRRARPR